MATKRKVEEFDVCDIKEFAKEATSCGKLITCPL